MKRSKTTKTQVPTPVATVTLEERVEYTRRQNLFLSAQTAALAAGAYLDQLGEDIKNRYDLPTVYNLDLQTGAVTIPEPAGETTD